MMDEGNDKLDGFKDKEMDEMILLKNMDEMLGKH